MSRLKMILKLSIVKDLKRQLRMIPKGTKVNTKYDKTDKIKVMGFSHLRILDLRAQPNLKKKVSTFKPYYILPLPNGRWRART